MPRAELLAAVLTCAHDHVAFVEKEVRRLGVPVSPASASEAVGVTSTGKPIVGAVVPGPTPFDRLRRFINGNSKRGFIDLRPPRPSRLRFIVLKLRAMRSKAARAPVYVGEHNGAKEYWFPGDVFAEVAGGAREALALKQDVASRGLLETTRRATG